MYRTNGKMAVRSASETKTKGKISTELASDSNIKGRISAESAEECFIRGFSLKIEGSKEQNGSMIGFIWQKIMQHGIRIGFI